MSEQREVERRAISPQELSPASPQVLLVAAQRSDIGAIRERNEDASLILICDASGHFPLHPFGFFLVADGMGGHYGGDQASTVASRVTADHVLQNILLPFLRDQLPAAAAEIEKLFCEAVLAAHDAVRDPDPARKGGTTLTAALIIGQELFLAHVGDSRAYLLANGQLELLTRDHSLVQRLVDTGQLTDQEAQEYQYRNVLLRALGQEDDLIVDTRIVPLSSHGRVLLCSDGLCGQISHQDLHTILDQRLPPAPVTEDLIAAALAAGGPDNITAVVVDFAFT